MTKIPRGNKKSEAPDAEQTTKHFVQFSRYSIQFDFNNCFQRIYNIKAT